MMTPKTLGILTIVPYWRNPRRIADEAVEAVMESIRQFGYQTPIVVDTENVIIMGHTRYQALRRLGVKEVPVLVASTLNPQQVKELRTIDNRTSEYSRWDFEKLMEELDGADSALMQSFFPEVFGPTDAELKDGEDAIEKMTVEVTYSAPINAEFVCPECFHMWEMDVTKEDVLSGELYLKNTDTEKAEEPA
ncbi:ParB-like partition protein [Microbacterium phage Hendrix]|uniref:ParB-like nuclease domain protein n=1 Tax=Microbacterium phage Hendrix TaxID=2182341 RepID=A0A2U8UUC7_9CAUD|nr:ParB-like partition protein [Microbacterium phage Hendrix]AWN07673.1 ParB-like nuclease domain protein [Microbacterium phage Hendrix]